jgi:peptidoglycan/LPS O-acetylase OafA/YrhL
MSGALSLYLDALRFVAAFTVFLSHYSVGRISGGSLWHLTAYGRTAVLAFFVLSGFVIAWVSESREHTLQDYALSRVARLYSVIIPAFFLTALLDHIGSWVDPTLYGPEWRHSTAHPALGYALSGVFLGESWTLAVLPGFNVPFWSLNYEAWYYVLFAAVALLSGRLRAVTFGTAALIAGPKILALFPVWLMGVAAWRWRAAIPKHLGWPLIVSSLAGFVALEASGGQSLFWHPETLWVPPDYSAYDYILAALVALLILGLANAPLPLPGARLERIVRALAGASFGLYLLHYPLLNFFGTIVSGPPDGGVHRVLVFGLTLGCGLGLASLIEPRKGAFKRALQLGFYAALGKPLGPALPDRRLSRYHSRTTGLF